jgi:hypothetical protein
MSRENRRRPVYFDSTVLETMGSELSSHRSKNGMDCCTKAAAKTWRVRPSVSPTGQLTSQSIPRGANRRRSKRADNDEPYSAGPGANGRDLLPAYENDMSHLSRRYADDVAETVLHAESLMEIRLRQLWKAPEYQLIQITRGP